MSEPSTEIVRCYIHGVDEPFTPGVDYKACGECWHVWPTEEAFRADMIRLCEEMNSSQWRQPDEADWVVPADLDEVYSCPLCSHDF